MEQKKNSMIWGIFLIVVGIVFLIGNVSRVGMETLWPVFPMAVGLAFWVGFVHDRKNYGLLMPGSILVIVSILFLYCSIFGWWRMETLWPVFILAPAVGFIAMYFAGAKDQGLLVPAGILSAVGIIFLFVSSGLGDYWPIFLIIGGILLMAFGATRKKGPSEEKKA